MSCCCCCCCPGLREWLRNKRRRRRRMNGRERRIIEEAFEFDGMFNNEPDPQVDERLERQLVERRQQDRERRDAVVKKEENNKEDFHRKMLKREKKIKAVAREMAELKPYFNQETVVEVLTHKARGPKSARAKKPNTAVVMVTKSYSAGDIRRPDDDDDDDLGFFFYK